MHVKNPKSRLGRLFLRRRATSGVNIDGYADLEFAVAARI